MKRTILSAMLLLATFATAMAQDLDSKYATNLLKPGTVAPDFTLRTADEKDIKLRAFRGNYVVLDFWASWCSDCRKDIPAMKQLWSDFMDYNVRIIGISFDTSKEAWVNTYWDKYHELDTGERTEEVEKGNQDRPLVPRRLDSNNVSD